MKVLLTDVQVPFIAGGAEACVSSLREAFQARGHSVEILTLPFRFSPLASVKESMQQWQGLQADRFDCGEIDLVVATRFPSYHLVSDRMVVWLVHQHRAIYDLWDTPYGESSSDPRACAWRQEILEADTRALRKARSIWTISQNVSDRLRRFNQVDSRPLYQPPPLAHAYRPGPSLPYVYFPSRMETLKRQDLLIRAMAMVDRPVMAVFSGTGGRYEDFRALAESIGVADRVIFTGHVDFERKRDLYSQSMAVFFGPKDEDYGFITLEAMLSSKPVITCSDSGGVLEFVQDGQSGHVCPPEPEAIAQAINQMARARQRCIEMGQAGRARYDALDISWDRVTDHLLQD
ncbi:MAG: hypothetical protein RIQ97_2907 [Pseudomonadota bacterium]